MPRTRPRPLRDWDGALFRIKPGMYRSVKELAAMDALGCVEVDRYELGENEATPYWNGAHGERLRWPHRYYWAWEVLPPGGCGRVTDGAWYGSKQAAVLAAMAYVELGELTDTKYQP